MSDEILFRVELFNEKTQTFDLSNSRVNEAGLRHILKKVIGAKKSDRNDFVARVLTKHTGYFKELHPAKQPYSMHCVKITQGQPIIDSRTGIIYPSHRAATNDLGAPKDHMAEFFAGKRKDVEGHVFKAYLGNKE